MNINNWIHRGFNPKVIYDIGANVGEWTSEYKKYFPNAQFILFDGNEDNKQKCKHENYNIVLLGQNNNEEKKFYCSKKEYNTGNSMYLELSTYFEENTYEIRNIETQTLDSYITKNNIPLPEFIKMDVQGAELDILIGGSKCVKNTSMILLEVGIHQYNTNAPLFADVVHYMNMIDFEVVDILGTHINSSYLSHLDILFAKKDSGYRLNSFKF